jgi:hypothetical protein
MKNIDLHTICRRQVVRSDEILTSYAHLSSTMILKNEKTAYLSVNGPHTPTEELGDGADERPSFILCGIDERKSCQ